MQLQSAANRIKRIFRDNLFERTVESKRGKINFSSLHKHKTSTRIFSKPQANWGKKYNIEILLDTSGSMQRDNRFYRSIQTCAKICELLWPVADVSVATFNYIEERMTWKDIILKSKESREDLEKQYMNETYFDTLVVENKAYITKQTWSTQWCLEYDEWECMDRRMPSSWDWYFSYYAAAGNREICNIVNAAERLKNKEWHKFIIVILDWQPNLDEHSERRRENMHLHIAWQSTLKYNTWNYRDTIVSLERQWYNILGIWLWDWADGIKDYFPKNIILYKPDDVYGILVDYFEKFTHKKGGA